MKLFRNIIAVCVMFAILCPEISAKGERINWSFKSVENGRPKILEGCEVDLKNSLYIGKEGEKMVYLTFDAGYSNENVEKILDVLKSHDAKAAFFILPGIIKNSPEVVKRMGEEGHFVCNHTTSHKDMSKITDLSKFEKELKGVEEQYKELTGLDMKKYYRPPEGAFSQKTIDFGEELGYRAVFWSFAYADWDNSKQLDAEKTKTKILDSVYDGMVLLLHPTSRTNALILDDVLTELESRGYSFGTLDDLSENQA